MRDRDSLTRLLTRHGAGSGERAGAEGRRQGRSGSNHLFDAEAKVRLLDASLEVLAALRALADVTEDIVRERRDSLAGGGEPRRAPSERSDPADVRRAEPPTARTREQIPLTY
jgi:hypothetical protein